MLKSWKMTVFVPTNQAIKMFLERNSQQQLVDGFNSDLLQYHLGMYMFVLDTQREREKKNKIIDESLT